MIRKQKLNNAFAFLLVCSIANCMNAQTYYGSNGKGRFTILNDSVAVGFFEAGIGVDCWAWKSDTFRLKRNHDTLFVTSMHSKQLLHPYLSNGNVKMENVEDLPSIGLYSYIAEYDSWRIEHMGAWGDSVRKKTFLNRVFLHKGLYVIVEELYGSNRRFSFYCDSSGYYDIEMDYGSEGVVLNEMPLLVKGKRLIPANDSLQICCWAENDFFLPVMRKRSKYRFVDPLCLFMYDNKNLPKDAHDMSFVPKRQLKYLKSLKYRQSNSSSNH